MKISKCPFPHVFLFMAANDSRSWEILSVLSNFTLMFWVNFYIRFIFLLSAQFKKINLIYLLVLCTVEEGKSFISTVSHDIGVNILFRESNLLLNYGRKYGNMWSVRKVLPTCIAEFLTLTLFHYFLDMHWTKSSIVYKWYKFSPVCENNCLEWPSK